MRALALLLLLGGCDLVFELREPGEAGPGLRRRTIEIPALEIQEPLTNFPINVSLAADADVAAFLRSDGFDLRFEQDGILLAHEIVEVDVSSGAFDAWVRLPELVPPRATFDMLYGDGLELPRPPPEDVWGNQAAGVWHMSESTNAIDSSRNDLALRPTDGGSPGVAAGIAGKARRFASNQLCAGGTDFRAESGSFSYSLWVFVEAILDEFDCPFGRGGGDSSNTGWNIELGSDDWVANVSDGQVNRVSTLSAIPITGWVHLAVVVDRQSGELRTYTNGAQVDTANIATLGSMTAESEATCLGNRDIPFAGLIDEPRLWSKPLSPDAIGIEYRNLGERETFMRIGDPILE